jgi:hypothetical protein
VGHEERLKKHTGFIYTEQAKPSISRAQPPLNTQ